MATTIAQIIPLLFVLGITSAIGWVLYQTYLTYMGVKAATKTKMSKKHLDFSRDGLKVGVKDVNSEKYVDGTQKWVVKAWNLSGHGIKDK
ncbi:hypothetical protein TD95_004849 [Thielaviopsis punctulata]|uniref:Uncharacterized protein n=1 Tax=Thielaviopsis punctulata TaxID=72032 RepID=A0A0F4ZBV7_9PEZI|nr:hypothetical protein TD95_004849 [Thielaviopsis punctulata]